MKKKLQIRGNITLFIVLIALSISLVLGAYYGAEKIKANNETIKSQVNGMTVENLSALIVEENMLKSKVDELTKESEQVKTEKITKFDKDVFSTTLSTFAQVNNLDLTSFQERGFSNEGEGFYSVRYDLTVEGSIYGMMEFFNLIRDMGTQYSIDYFSFRQNGSYSWLSRNTDKEDILKWINSAKDTVTEKLLLEMIALNTKIENNDYDYGTTVTKPSSTMEDYDPLQNLLDSLLQAEYDDKEMQDYKANTEEEAKKTEEALARKEADKKIIQEFLDEYYPQGTIIKDGQLIVPVLDGNMKFDIGITFTGNDSGSTQNTNLSSYLIPPSSTTSEEKDVIIYWDGEIKNVPNIIEGVDVTLLNELEISPNTTFTVSWNNNELTRQTVESFLSEKEDGGYSELSRVAAEIRFLQKNGKSDLALMQYLVYLYEYLVINEVLI